MNAYEWLILYSVSILIASFMGGYLPFLGQVSHNRLQLYLSFSAGIMLGASFFHVMPEAMELAGSGFGWWMSLGVVGLFCIERFIAPHSHEIDSQHTDEVCRQHEHEHSHAHDHPHELGTDKEHPAAAPAVAGWMAVLGLTIHTFMNGVGLAGAVQAETSALKWPGFALFLAIILHKPADALAISTVLTRKGVSRRALMFIQVGFVLMIPVGVAAFYLAKEVVQESLQSELTGAALAFSAGTFLFIALSDLLPEVQFHRHDRFWLFLALILGVGGMGGIALLEGHDHGGGHHHHAGEIEKNHDHDEHDEHDHDHMKHDHDHDHK